MKFDQIDRYPSCDSYIRGVITTYGRQCNQISDAFRKYCESDELAEEALTFGLNPLIHIGDVDSGTNGEYRGRAGGPKDIVYINVRVAEEYEFNGRADILESTVLHEMVHWARFKGGKPSKYDGKEAGVEFEIAAYGRNINCGCYTMCERLQ